MKHDRYERLIELEGRRSALKPSGRDRLALIKLERLVSELLDKATLGEIERNWLRMNKAMYLGSLLELEHNAHRQVGWVHKLVLLLDRMLRWR